MTTEELTKEIEQILDCAYSWVRESDRDDCGHPWDEAERLCKAAPALLAACRHAAQSYHHPSCKCKRVYYANPDQYCTCHVQKARAAIAQTESQP